MLYNNPSNVERFNHANDIVDDSKSFTGVKLFHQVTDRHGWEFGKKSWKSKMPISYVANWIWKWRFQLNFSSSKQIIREFISSFKCMKNNFHFFRRCKFIEKNKNMKRFSISSTTQRSERQTFLVRKKTKS